MSVKDLTSVFSRYFLVGTYFPAFFGLVALSVTLPSSWLPAAIRIEHLWSAEGGDFGHPLLAMAALAIPIALLLSGSSEALQRVYRDLPFLGLYGRVPEKLLTTLTAYQRWRQARLVEDAYGANAAQQVRNRAATALLERMPHGPDDILPNRFANTARATEEYAATRWGLDAGVIRHHLPVLFTEGEAGLLDDARTQLAFAINFSFVLLAVGLAGLGRVIWVIAAGEWRWVELLRLIPLAAAYIAYRLLAVEALVTFGRRMRAAVDLHRFELYKAFGVASFRSFSQEELLHGQTLSDFILYGRRRDERGLATFGRSANE